MSASVTLTIQRGGAGTSSFESVTYEVPHFANMDILDALRMVREMFEPSLGYRAACGEGKCGLCGVLANGRPVLACKTRLEANEAVTLEPLPGFPVIRDLLVDRSLHYCEERELLARVESRREGPRPVDREVHDDFVAYKNCTECSLCSAGCPAAPSLSHGHVGPAGFLHAIRAVHLEDRAQQEGASELYRCLLCGRCVETCPRGVPVTRLNRAARGDAAARSSEPHDVGAFLRRLSEQHVIALSGERGTGGWLRAAPAEVVEHIGARASLGVFVGCQYGLRSARSLTPIRLASLLTAAGVEFTLLGEAEWCCGHPYELAGQPERAREAAEHNVRAFLELGVETVVAACPGCYTAFAAEYSKILGKQTGLRAEHASQLLLRLLAEGRLRPDGQSLGKVVYHDPCELGRLHGIYDAPREILEHARAIVAEAAPSRERASCCGAGGLAAAGAPDVAKQASGRRVRELLETNPNAIVTACPNCEITLEAALRQERSRVRVLDVIDALAESVGGNGGSKGDTSSRSSEDGGKGCSLDSKGARRS